MRSEANQRVEAALGGIVVLAIQLLPAAIMVRVGSSGSMGDIAEVEHLALAVVVSLIVAVAAGVLMYRALQVRDADVQIGRYDPWAALFVGAAVLALGLALVPAVILVMLVPDENKPFGSRADWVLLVWVVGQFAAAGAGAFAGWATLVRSRRRASSEAPGSESS